MGRESRLGHNPARERHVASPVRRVWIDILTLAGRVVGAHRLGLEYRSPIGLNIAFSPKGTPQELFYVDLAGVIACEWRFPERPFRLPYSAAAMISDESDPTGEFNAFDQDLWEHREQVRAVEHRLHRFPKAHFVYTEIVKPFDESPFDFDAFTRQQHRRWRRCERKKRHTTEADARRHAALPRHEGTHAYACSQCGGWHVGHPLKTA